MGRVRREIPKTLYERVLARVAAGVDLPPVRPPKASAAVVPWRRAADGGGEVFWMRRAESLAFMGGWHAFPGGGLARGDAEVAVDGEPAGAAEGPADAGMPVAVVGDLELGPAVPPGLVACALRELFEETGLLLGPAGTAEDELERQGRELAARLARGERFGPALAAVGARLDASRLVYAGRWLTPPLGPLRFDNRFFLLEWPAAARVQPHGESPECAEVEWVRPAAALDRWRRAEVITAPPILHLLQVLAEDGPEAGLERLRNPVEANLGPHRRIEFQPGVLVFPLPTPTLPPATHTNAYLLGHGECVLVDPGSPYEAEIDGLLEALAAAATMGRETRAVWLTHHHPDHVGGVQRVRESLGVPVLAHPATADRLRTQGIPIDGLLEDGQLVTLAGDPELALRVLHTPGHARGHLCFLEERTGALVAGDMVTAVGTIVVDPPEGDMDDYLASLERLAGLEPRTLFPAHGPTIRAPAAKLREYVEHRLWRERKILEAWQAGARTPAELLPRVYDDVPEIAHPLAERQLQAHLDRLDRHGRL